MTTSIKYKQDCIILRLQVNAHFEVLFHSAFAKSNELLRTGFDGLINLNAEPVILTDD